MRRRLLFRLLLALAGGMTVAIVLLTATPQGQAVTRAVLIVTQVVPSFPMKPQEWFTAAPTHERIEIPVFDGSGTLDIYRPEGQGPYPAVLLFLGVAPAGADDPRVKNLGSALARSGMVAAFYWSPMKLQKRINPNDTENLVKAFTYLQERPYVDPVRVGLGGFCVGASFALVAAAHQEIRDDVTFVNAFGPYFDMRDLAQAIASRTRFYGDTASPWPAGSLTREVFELQLLESLDDPGERTAVLGALGGDKEALAGLSPEAHAIYRLLNGLPLQEAAQAVEQLPAAFLEDLRRISPAANLAGLKARVLVMHDREDNLVPSDESRRLADALEHRGDVYSTEFSLFQHMDPTRPVGPLTFTAEAWKLFLHMYNVLRAAF